MQISLESGLGTVLCEIDKSGQLVCTRYRITLTNIKQKNIIRYVKGKFCKDALHVYCAIREICGVGWDTRRVQRWSSRS